MFNNILHRKKLVSDEKKLVSDFEHFPITIPIRFRQRFWGVVVWLVLRLSTSFSTDPPTETYRSGVMSG